MKMLKKKTVLAEAADDKRRAPRGHFVVYVGTGLRRFVVPMWLLKKQLFQELLDKAAEEYGFHGRSKLVLPCDESYFQGLLITLMPQS